MRIELNSGGLASGAIIHECQSNFDSLVSGSRKMVAAFQTIKSFTSNINGGIGSLQEAVDRISSRAQHDDSKSGVLESVQRKANSFVELARRIDLDVGGQVNRNKNEFYNVNPWSRPPQPKEEKKWYQKAWDHVCGTAGQIKDGIKHLKDVTVKWGKNAADSIAKGWKKIATWYNENKDFIKQVAIEIAIGAAVIGLAALTGGTSLVITVAITAGVGAVLGGVGGGVGYYIEHGTLKGASKTVIGGFAKGFMSGAISGYIGGEIGIAGKAFHWSRATTVFVGAGSNGLTSAGTETIHSIANGSGITKEEKMSILKSGLIGTITGGYGAYKGYGKETLLSTLQASEKYKDVFTSSTYKEIRYQAIRNEIAKKMKKGIGKSIRKWLLMPTSVY